jgi:hypothetical protein
VLSFRVDYIIVQVSKAAPAVARWQSHGAGVERGFGDKNKDYDFKEQWCWDVYGQGMPQLDIAIAEKG